MTDEQLLADLQPRIIRFGYCSIDFDQAPFSQVERIAKTLKMTPVAGMLCHGLLPKKSQVEFGGAKK